MSLNQEQNKDFLRTKGLSHLKWALRGDIYHFEKWPKDSAPMESLDT